MPPSLRAFLAGLIDYAGLFPPARLDLGPALHNYARYRVGDDAWMLGRFIIPVTRLEELNAYAGLFAERLPVRFSVLGGRLDAEAPESVGGVLDAARAFELRHEERVAADRFEFALAPALTSDVSALGEVLGAFTDAGAHAAGAPRHGFFEVDLLGDGFEAGVETAAEAVAAHNASVGSEAVGVKLRCGGVTPAAFPSVEAVAHALLACRDAGAPFKATAGLHHPVRHYADSVRAPMHGFLNVFGGAILARAGRLDRTALERLLDDEHAAHFTFSDDGFAWMDHGATAEAVADARAHFATSYGSCSFDEPREDLQALGLLDAIAA